MKSLHLDFFLNKTRILTRDYFLCPQLMEGGENPPAKIKSFVLFIFIDLVSQHGIQCFVKRLPRSDPSASFGAALTSPWSVLSEKMTCSFAWGYFLFVKVLTVRKERQDVCFSELHIFLHEIEAG